MRTVKSISLCCPALLRRTVTLSAAPSPERPSPRPTPGARTQEWTLRLPVSATEWQRIDGRAGRDRRREGRPLGATGSWFDSRGTAMVPEAGAGPPCGHVTYGEGPSDHARLAAITAAAASAIPIIDASTPPAPASTNPSSRPAPTSQGRRVRQARGPRPTPVIWPIRHNTRGDVTTRPIQRTAYGRQFPLDGGTASGANGRHRRCWLRACPLERRRPLGAWQDS